jgi:hypothetical protein
MPRYKYIANRFLTALQNLFLNHKLSEYHTGYRAFSREVLEKLPLEENSNDFVFDNQMLAQVIYFGFRVGEVTCPTRYFADASSINFRRSMLYGMGVLKTSLQFRMNKSGLYSFSYFSPEGRKLGKIKAEDHIHEVRKRNGRWRISHHRSTSPNSLDE